MTVCSTPAARVERLRRVRLPSLGTIRYSNNDETGILKRDFIPVHPVPPRYSGRGPRVVYYYLSSVCRHHSFRFHVDYGLRRSLNTNISPHRGGPARVAVGPAKDTIRFTKVRLKQEFLDWGEHSGIYKRRV